MPDSAGALLGLIAGLFFTFSSHAMAQKAAPDLISSSPFEPCESTLNCVHEVHLFNTLPSDLAVLTLEVLNANKSLDTIIQGTVDHHRIDAVFNAWKYKDDVHIAIEVHDEGSILFIKSVSREGKFDLGVNKRRVKGIIKALTERENNR